MTVVDRIDRTKASPELLWDEFVCQRQPVVVQSFPLDKHWRANLWTNAYLMRKAGRSRVSVEYRSSDSEGFGLGKRRTMLFKEFLSRISQGQENLYLTSPEQPIGPNGFPDVMVPPVLLLESDIPSRMSWAGNLVPQQINMWMGNSVHGTSSGLHHDYHDNFYVLLRGRKRFRLFPPSLAERMYTHGKIVKIHSNGRIVYQGQEGIQEDGSHIDDVRIWEESSSTKEDEIIEANSDIQQKELDKVENPPSFSMVDLSMSKDSILEKFPGFPYDSCIECTVSAGETLYLPAGWFHEVTSLNGGEEHGPGHLAINYWLYPPDNLVAGNGGFSQPYTRAFWNDMWKSGKIRIGKPQKKSQWTCKKNISKYKQRYGRPWLCYFLKNRKKRKRRG